MRLLQKKVFELLQGLVLVLVLLLIFSCAFSAENSARELKSLTVIFEGNEYYPDNLSSYMKLELPVTRPLGDTSTLPPATEAKVDKVEVSSGASYVVYNENININDFTRIIIEVTAEDGTKKNYVLIIEVGGGFSITNTYVNNGHSVLGRGFMDPIMPNNTAIITANNMMPNSTFNWKIKDAADNLLIESVTPKTSTVQGEISILKSDFTLAARNNINALISDTDPEAALSLEVSATGDPLKIAIETVTYSPYKLYTWHDIQAIESEDTKDYILQQDVRFPDRGQEGFPIDGFRPIACDCDATPNKQGSRYSGKFDGAGYTISNFSINRPGPEGDFIGLFSQLDAGAEVKDLIISHVGVTGNNYVGVLAGELERGTISGVAVIGPNGALVEGLDSVGGLIGYVEAGRVNSLRGYSATNVSGVNSVGGLAGGLGNIGVLRTPNVVMGYTTGTISGTYNVGGLVGENMGTVIGYSLSSIQGRELSGGLVGRNYGVVEGYFLGSVTRTAGSIRDEFGLLVGINATHPPPAVNVHGNSAGYHANKARFVGIVIGDTRHNSNGRPGLAGHGANIVGANARKAQFGNFIFDADRWSWVANGKWPAIYIGTIKAAADQPIDP